MNSYVWIKGEKIHIKDLEISQIKKCLEFIENNKKYNNEKYIDVDAYRDLLIELIVREKRSKKMTNEFTVRSQWESRFGYRAVVVDVHDNHLIVWHEGEIRTRVHEMDGKYLTFEESPFDLIRPWKEPDEGKCYLYIGKAPDGTIISAQFNDNIDYKFPEGYKSLARVAVNWKEGQFDD